MTSELCRPLTEVEVPDENDAIECTHEEQCSEVENMSDDESEVQCGDEEEEGRRSQASELPWSADDSRTRQACRVTSAIPQLVLPLRHRKSQKQAAQNRQGVSEEHTVLGADYCFIGGESAVHESP